METFPVILVPVSMKPPLPQGLDLRAPRTPEGAEIMGEIMQAQAPLLALAAGAER